MLPVVNVLNGAVLAACKPRHRHQVFLSFLREIDKAVPAELDIHCIADNYATHNHPKIKAWLATRPRWHIHFIPTYSSWLNQIERFFGHCHVGGVVSFRDGKEEVAVSRSSIPGGGD